MESYQIFYPGSPTEPLTEPITAELTNSAAEGKFLLWTDDNALEKVIFQAQKAGSIGAITTWKISVGGYLGYHVNDPSIALQVTIPITEVGGSKQRDLLWKLYQNDSIATATILPDTAENPWYVVMSSPWQFVWIAVMVAFSVVNIVLAIIKINQFVRAYGGCKQAIVFFVLPLEIFSNVIRIVASLDMFGNNRLYPYWLTTALGELSFPFVLSSLLLFILFWHEMMTREAVVLHPFIDKMRIPFYAVSGFILALQIVRIIVFALNIMDGSSFITSIVYLVIAVFIVVFYYVTAIKLIKRMQMSKKLGRAVNLKRSTIKVLINGFLILAFVVLTIVFTMGSESSPAGWVTMWFILFALLNATSMVNIMAFESSTKGSSSRTTEKQLSQVGTTSSAHSAN
eukprot:TRINITY_DN2720_c0_g1_i2.p1 TRINITY_DN2720_c0_g1~~TRINITY_DN2720_c0_g1_i2.p1  ORF type:complete len:456 (-),score=20.21 TRINITY_DN2720_c0_g1_i2:47-1243(-)